VILDNNGIHRQDVVCVITINVVLFDSQLDGHYLFYMLHLLRTFRRERILGGMACKALCVKCDNVAKQT